jgi:thioredoxin reductase
VALYDALIIGGGPAGASCALWLTRLRLPTLLVEAGPRLGGLLNNSPFTNDWLVTQPGATGGDLAVGMERSLREAGAAVLLGNSVESVRRASAGFAVTLDGPSNSRAPIMARFVVLATGVQPVRGGMEGGLGVLFGPGAHVADQDFSGRRVAILGGGDNAFENHASVMAKGAASARIFARNVRAARWARALVGSRQVAVGPYKVDAAQGRVDGQYYDIILVMYGWEPRPLPLVELDPERDTHGFVRVDPATCETSCVGLYAIGEVTRRGHPCVPTAVADGVVAAKAIQQRIEVS